VSPEQLGREVTSGSFLLSAGDLFAKAIAALGSMFIARLLCPSDYGLISVALIFPTMLSGLTDLGISQALIRFTASSKPERYIAAGIFFKLVAGTFSALLIYFFAGPIASLVLVRPYLEPFLKVLSVYIVSNVVLGSVTSTLVGLGRYGINAILQVVQNTLRVIVTLFLILSGMGLYGAILGFSVSYAISSVLAFAILWRYSGLPITQPNVTALKPMLLYSLPLYAPVLLSLPLSQYYNLLLAWFVTNDQVGNYSIALNLLTPLALVGGSVSTAIFSAYSKSPKRDKSGATLNKTILYTTIIMTPISLSLIVLSQPITYIIYGESYGLAPQYLSLLALGGLYSVLGSYVIDSYFKSAGATTRNLQVSLVGTAVAAPFALPMVMHFGIAGSIASGLTGNLVASIYALCILKARDSTHVNVFQAARALLSPLTAAGISALAMLPLTDFWAKTAIGATAYLLTLALTMPAVVGVEDIRNLKALASTLKLVGRISDKGLSLELKLAELIHGRPQAR